MFSFKKCLFKITISSVTLFTPWPSFSNTSHVMASFYAFLDLKERTISFVVVVRNLEITCHLLILCFLHSCLKKIVYLCQSVFLFWFVPVIKCVLTWKPWDLRGIQWLIKKTSKTNRIVLDSSNFVCAITHTHTHTHTHIYIHTHTHIYIYIYI